METDNKVVNFFKRLIYKIKIRLKNGSLRREMLRRRKELKLELSRYSSECATAIEIIKLQSKKKDTEVLYAPVSGEFYITNEDTYIIFKGTSINIINGCYNYHIDIPLTAHDYLDKYLKRIVERRRSKTKKEIEAKISRSLLEILEHVKGN